MTEEVSHPRPDNKRLAVALAGLGAGSAAHLAGAAEQGDGLWAVTAGPALVSTAWSVGAGVRRRQPGVDIVAVLALAGCLAVGEFLAGAVIALMVASGAVLEGRAAARARRELAGLLERAPRTVHRYAADGLSITDPALSDVVPGDRLLVKPGRSCRWTGGANGPATSTSRAHRRVPARGRAAGDAVRGGSHQRGRLLSICGPGPRRPTSTYAGIVRLVEQADGAAAVRPHGRSLRPGLPPLTLASPGRAWTVSGEPVRAVAVLVVATPCPLILAAPGGHRRRPRARPAVAS